ncbi:SixA phosphatase family protein [Neptuniibacter sp. QD29_5]|uniref:SixA phosphatase family protein n=1 Tax=Neptuniibacter sp. QD29_5 TaxID=3398207 RepID=UPI0039F4AF00
MKRLTLIRHAKSSWKDPTLDDFERPLNKRGQRDLPKMATRLGEYGIEPELILASNANRALTTASEIHRHLNLKPEQLQTHPELYASCTETLMYLLQNQSDHLNSIMLVGHNPALHQLADMLTQSHLEKFPTAAVLHMHLSITQWHELAAGCATSILFDYPKKHASTAA